MNIQKSAAVVAAMLITAAGMAGIANYSNAAAVSSANRAVEASTQVITLPAMNVHPSREQLKQLRGGDAGITAPASLQMPYYSFASDTVSA